MVSEINNVRVEQYLTVPFIDLQIDSRQKTFFESLFSAGDSNFFMRAVNLEAFVPLHLLDFVSSIRREHHMIGNNAYDVKSTPLSTFVISLAQKTCQPEMGIRLNDFKKTERQSLKLYFRDESVCEQFNMLLHAHCRGVRVMEKLTIGRESQFFLCNKVAHQLYETQENKNGFSKLQLTQYSDFVVEGDKIEKMRTTFQRTLELIHNVEQTYKLVEVIAGSYKLVLAGQQ